MSTLRRSFRVCRAELIRWRKDYHVWLILALVTAFSLLYLAPYYEFSIKLGIPSSPWLLPMELVGRNFRPILFGCAAFLFSGLSSRSSSQRMLYVRTGVKSLLLGKLDYVVLVSFLYTLFCILIALLPHVSRIYLTKDWGPLLQEWCFRKSETTGWQLANELRVLQSGTGLYMTLEMFLLFWMANLVIGLVVFGLNAGGGVLRGVFGAGVLVGMDMLGGLGVNGLFGIRHSWFFWISPLGWCSPSLLDFGLLSQTSAELLFPTVVQAFLLYGGLILFLVLALWLMTLFTYRNGSRRQWIRLAGE